jgi:hypothetical protein
MLCLSGEAAYIDEPFTPSRAPAWLAEPLPQWFMYITDENAGPYRAQLERVMELRYPLWDVLKNTRKPKQLARQVPEVPRALAYRWKKLRPLLKDPLAIFSSEWLARTFDMQVVVMIRHPAAFISSIKRLNWGFDYEEHWLAQELLMRDLLGHRAAEYRGYQGEIDLVGEGIVMWNSIYDVISQFRERHPEWYFIRYEDLAGDPVTGFEELYGQLGLRWSDQVRAGVARSSGSQNPKEVRPSRRRAVRRDSAAAKQTWLRRLTPEEIDRIRRETAEVSGRFYGDEDWS